MPSFLFCIRFLLINRQLISANMSSSSASANFFNLCLPSTSMATPFQLDMRGNAVTIWSDNLALTQLNQAMSMIKEEIKGELKEEVKSSSHCTLPLSTKKKGRSRPPKHVRQASRESAESKRFVFYRLCYDSMILMPSIQLFFFICTSYLSNSYAILRFNPSETCFA